MKWVMFWLLLDDRREQITTETVGDGRNSGLVLIAVLAFILIILAILPIVLFM